MRRIFYFREKRRTRRIRYSIIASLAAPGISAATGPRERSFQLPATVAGAIRWFWGS